MGNQLTNQTQGIKISNNELKSTFRYLEIEDI